MRGRRESGETAGLFDPVHMADVVRHHVLPFLSGKLVHQLGHVVVLHEDASFAAAIVLRWAWLAAKSLIVRVEFMLLSEV